ncbi:helix-turn-helix transcriptional regulator [Brevibacillus sp. HB1.1]|uniref:helix-turn-helix domain-containing protein n=1 Tax=Brevibacillus sp. HB1.1 TaxID=2738808 RepID=UPI001575ECCE|nr:helix-turn-helix transcriptional regulator [Brevibacillus sp. HB1.1]
MTLVNFAKSLGISHASLSEIESDKSTPSIEVLLSLVIQYKVDMHWHFLSKEMVYMKEMEKDEVIDYINLKLLRYK